MIMIFRHNVLIILILHIGDEQSTDVDLDSTTQLATTAPIAKHQPGLAQQFLSIYDPHLICHKCHPLEHALRLSCHQLRASLHLALSVLGHHDASPVSPHVGTSYKLSSSSSDGNSGN